MTETDIGYDRQERLDQLAAMYAKLKPQVTSLEDQLKAVTDAIKVELTQLYPGQTTIPFDNPALEKPLKLTYVESKRVDSKRLASEDPATYHRYLKTSGSWYLKVAS